MCWLLFGVCIFLCVSWDSNVAVVWVVGVFSSCFRRIHEWFRRPTTWEQSVGGMNVLASTTASGSQDYGMLFACTVVGPQHACRHRSRVPFPLPPSPHLALSLPCLGYPVSFRWARVSSTIILSRMHAAGFFAMREWLLCVTPKPPRPIPSVYSPALLCPHSPRLLPSSLFWWDARSMV
ncbi:unnamed protein product [Ectocarpus sp. 12 AP-2014]